MKQNSNITDAISIHEQLSIFLEPKRLYDYNNEYRKLMNWVCGYLENGNQEGQKYVRFQENESLLQPPLTVLLAKMVIQKNKKALKARDKFIDILANNKHKVKDYLNTEYDMNKIMGKVYEYWYKKPNDFIIIDLPKKDENKTLSPQIYFLNISHVIDYQHDDFDNLLYVEWSYKEDEETYIIRFDQENRTVMNNDGAIILQVKHNLGYCPAKQLSTMRYRADTKDLKKSIFVDTLGVLREIWYWAVSNNYASSYLAYPIMWMFSDDETNNEESFRDFTVNSNMKDEDKAEYLLRQKELSKQSSHVGAGELIEVTRQDPTQPFDVPLGKLDVDASGLNYLDDKMDKRIDLLVVSTMGKKGEAENEQAKNQKQVEQGFQSQQEVLSEIAKEMEMNHVFIVDTILTEKFGEAYQGSIIKYGNDFFRLSLEELWEQYAKAKEAGLINLLQEISEDIINVRYEFNEKKKETELLKNNLTPFYLSSNEEVTDWKDKFLISKEDWYKKINFPNLLKRFETENFTIDSFESDVTTEDKVKVINEEINKYIQEYLNSNKDEQKSRTMEQTEG